MEYYKPMCLDRISDSQHLNMATYATGMMDYTGGSAYDYIDQDSTASISATNLNTAVEASDINRLHYAAFMDANNITSTTTLAPATSSSAMCGASGPAHYPSNMLIFTAICAFVIAIIGTFGNLLTIIALPMTKKMRTTATAFVVNLAVVELLFCVLILPMSGAQYVYLQKNSISLLNNNDCIFFTVTRYTLTQVELQTILAIALTRALAVAFPSTYNFLNKSTVIGSYISFIWIYSFLLKLPTALGYLGSYGFNPCTMECDMVSGDAQARFIMVIVDAIIPVVAIVVLYIFVFIMVKRSSNRVARASVRSTNKVVPPSTSTASTSSEPGEDQRKGSSSSFKSLKKMISDSSLRARLTHQTSTVSQRLCTNRRDMRVARTIFIIFLFVIICGVPVMLAHIFDRNVKYPVQFLVVHILYWLQYCLNVAVYVLMNRQYRDAYIDCLARVFPQFKRHHGRRFFWEKASISSKPAQHVPVSTRPRTDSADIADSMASEPETPVANHPPPIGVQGRLSTIPEGHSSSAANDSVFLDPPKKDEFEKKINENHSNHYNNDLNSEDEESEDELPEAEKQALMDEREIWVTQNGSTGGNLPLDESKL
ncbi:hypothetical protein SK128_006392 [Halocaridina rubra]|uniref:G-protein coupled receptors family 1 profile domain-containing protein n=1 Tax=Halocaridina rubra TaxID=373956 RepID=A0AAN8WBT5_HALRR